MALDPEYIDAIKKSEGYSPAASWDYKQNSSGYGTKAQPGDENIPPDQLRAVHEQRFSDEVGRAAASVDAFNPNLPPGVRAALTSLTYNAGPGWQQSGLGEAVKTGDYGKARDIFLQYNKAGGEVNPGLVARRAKEAAWFGGGLPSPQPQTASAPPASPLQAIPQQPAPSFVAPQQAAPQATQQPGSLYASMPVSQIGAPPPIFAPPRKPIDLSRLKAALASGNRGLFYGQG